MQIIIVDTLFMFVCGIPQFYDCYNLKLSIKPLFFCNIKSISTISSIMSATQSCEREIPVDVYEILHQVSDIEGIQMPSFTFSFHAENEVGLIANFFFATIQDQFNPVKREVVVKKALASEKVRSGLSVDKLYSNECLFYDSIWPTFVRFQKSALGGELFTGIATCYETELESMNEKLVLENLKFSNFHNTRLDGFMDKEHLELVFRKYGNFHGLSFAYKLMNPPTFESMCSEIYDYLDDPRNMANFKETARRGLIECSEYLESDGILQEMFQKYVDEKGVEDFCIFTKYQGKHSVLLHGDCWCSNIMFKYNESGKPTDLRFIDFQMIRLGTPVFDLSYVLYTEGTKETFEDLDYFLEVYHESFSKTLDQYGYDSMQFYSLESLRKEWKTCSKFGFLMSILLLKRKFLRKDKFMKLSEIVEKSYVTKKEDCDQEKIMHRCLNLVRHMFEHSFL